MVDDYPTMFVQGLNFDNDVYDFKNYKKAIYIFFIPIILAFFVLLVPLCGLSSIHYTNDDLALIYVDQWGYVMFQVVYCIIAFPCLLMPLAITFEDLIPRWYLWGVLPVIVTIG